MSYVWQIKMCLHPWPCYYAWMDRLLTSPLKLSRAKCNLKGHPQHEQLLKSLQLCLIHSEHL